MQYRIIVIDVLLSWLEKTPHFSSILNLLRHFHLDALKAEHVASQIVNVYNQKKYDIHVPYTHVHN